MSAKVVDWITVNGQHVPLLEGDSKEGAVNRAIAKFNSDKRDSDIQKNKEQAEKLNKERKLADLQKQYDEAKGILNKARIRTEMDMLKADWKGTKEEWHKHQEELHQKAVEESNRRQEAERRAKLEKEEAVRKNLEEELKTQPKDKVEQYKIIQETNPMRDDYHTGIRKPSDIMTWKEVMEKDKDSFAWGDFSRADGQRALESGKITIYSSYPIKQGVFVSTSKVQSEQYAGGKGNKVYSKTVPLGDVAWISGDEGQFAKIRR